MKLNSKDSDLRIALWGTRGSGKTFLVQAFIYKIGIINDNLRQSAYPKNYLNFSISASSRRGYVALIASPELPEPTFDSELQTFRFERRYISKPTELSIAQSVNSQIHNIQILDNPGERFNISFNEYDGQNLSYGEQTRQVVESSNNFILTIDLSSLIDPQITALREFLDLIANSKKQNCRIAICFTKMDLIEKRLTFDESPRRYLYRSVGTKKADEIESIFRFLERLATVRFFYVSSVGYYLSQNGRQVSNHDSNINSIADVTKWIPVAVESPFFWFFEEIEIERILRKDISPSILERIFHLGEQRYRSYIPYQDLLRDAVDATSKTLYKPHKGVESETRLSSVSVRTIDYLRPLENPSDIAMEIRNTSKVPIFIDEMQIDLKGSAHPLKINAGGKIVLPAQVFRWMYHVEPINLNINYQYKIFYHLENSKDKLSISGNSVLTFESIKIVNREKAINPYTLKALKENSPLFFGRKELLDLLFSDLGSADQGNVVVLFGQRRTGKTSLLYALKGQAPNELLPVIFDVEGRTTESDFYGGLALKIYDAFSTAGLTLPETKPEDFSTHAAYRFENVFLRSIKDIIGERRLLIMLDEFEYLQTAVDRGGLDKSIFPFLRNLIQHQRFMSFLFCGTHLLNELSQQYWQPFFNNALNRRVTFLDRESTEKLIAEPTEKFFDFDVLAIEKIWSLTAGHPFFTQLLCRYIVDQVNAESFGLVTTRLVDVAITKMLNVGNENLDAIWSEAAYLEKEIMRTLSQEYNAGKKYGIREQEFYKFFEEHNSKDDFERALNRLENKEILRLEGGYVSFMMELVPLWLNVRHPN